MGRVERREWVRKRGGWEGGKRGQVGRGLG